MKINYKKYFEVENSPYSFLIKIFVFVILILSIIFFVWSAMRYNRMQEEKRIKEEYIARLSENIDELQYLAEMPLDDEYKIRIAREKLGMCFADEKIYYTDIE